jgi:hypothetical protein
MRKWEHAFGSLYIPRGGAMFKPQVWLKIKNTTIVHFFSSVAHVCVPGAKTTGPIVKVCFFLNLIFMSVTIVSFNAIHSVIKKMFHKAPVAANGACQKWHILFLDIFQGNL